MENRWAIEVYDRTYMHDGEVGYAMANPTPKAFVGKKSIAHW